MSLEPMAVPGADHVRAPGAIGPVPTDGLDAARLQVLATEHWSLLATRSMSWNESFSRMGTFLSLVSGAVLALALVAQATGFREGFTLFALLLLPVVLFVGVATYVRLCAINNEDLLWIAGMNRLRAAVLGGVVAAAAGLAALPAIGLGVVAFAATLALLGRYQYGNITGWVRAWTPRFPSHAPGRWEL